MTVLGWYFVVFLASDSVAYLRTSLAKEALFPFKAL